MITELLNRLGLGFGAPNTTKRQSAGYFVATVLFFLIAMGVKAVFGIGLIGFAFIGAFLALAHGVVNGVEAGEIAAFWGSVIVSTILGAVLYGAV